MRCVAFEGHRRIASGELLKVARKTKEVIDRGERGPIVIFDEVTSQPVEVDFRGTTEQVLENYPRLTPESLRAVFAFAAECMREEALYTLPARPTG